MCYLESLLFRENMPFAIMFMNSNKSGRNISKRVEKVREKCFFRGINVGNDIVVSKGPNRDIDRPAINALISLVLRRGYKVVIVDKLTDITTDIYDLETFLDDAAYAGVKVFELSSMQYRRCVNVTDMLFFEFFRKW